MIKITFNKDKKFPGSLHRHLDVMMKAASDEAADLLSGKIAAGARSGKQYKKYPRVSSAPGEYPQEQFSELRNSVRVVKNGRMYYSVGFFGVDTEKLMDLEYGMGASVSTSGIPPMNSGYRSGQRKPLYKLFIGRDGKATRKAMNTAAEAVA